MTDENFCYVPHSMSKIFEDLGWEFATDLGPPHAAYASLYRWAKDGDPIMPPSTITMPAMAKIKKEESE